MQVVVVLVDGACDGTFAANVELAASAGFISPHGGPVNQASLVAGDLNGDHRVDLVIASTAASGVNVLPNTCR